MKQIKTIRITPNEDSNSGEHVSFVFNVYRNDDGSILDTLTIETACYGVHSSSIDLSGVVNSKVLMQIAEKMKKELSCITE